MDEAKPVMCMYTDGQFGSDLDLFTRGAEDPLLPNGEEDPLRSEGTIEEEIQADNDIFSDAEYEGGTTPFGFDLLGVAAEAIGDAFEAEAGPLALLDYVTHCESMASTFAFVVAGKNHKVASSEAWVLTEQGCAHGCPQEHLISAYQALGYQSAGGELGSEAWATASTELFEAFVGYYDPAASNHGRIVQDGGLHFDWRELGDEEWEISVHEGSKPAGFSG